MDTSGSSTALPPDFNLNLPLPHEFIPVGLMLYKPKRTDYNDEEVLREPQVHLSITNREV